MFDNFTWPTGFNRNESNVIPVTPAYIEPVPGWVDNLNGPVGLMIGAGKGVIRSMLCNGDYKAEVCPEHLN